jgi:hypothetical protein
VGSVRCAEAVPADRNRVVGSIPAQIFKQTTEIEDRRQQTTDSSPEPSPEYSQRTERKKGSRQETVLVQGDGWSRMEDCYCKIKKDSGAQFQRTEWVGGRGWGSKKVLFRNREDRVHSSKI